MRCIRGFRVKVLCSGEPVMFQVGGEVNQGTRAGSRTPTGTACRAGDADARAHRMRGCRSAPDGWRRRDALTGGALVMFAGVEFAAPSARLLSCRTLLLHVAAC